jgi:hypothetical protein
MDRLLKRRIRTVCDQGQLDGVDKKIWFKIVVDGGVLLDMRTPQSRDCLTMTPKILCRVPLTGGRNRQFNGQTWTDVTMMTCFSSDGFCHC